MTGIEGLLPFSSWAYPALAILVGLGNLGVPVPERTALLVAGYLLWDGRLSVLCVLASALLGAGLGAYLGYRIGRRLRFLTRWLPARFLPSEEPGLAARLVARHGAMGLFAARLLPGTRFVVNGIAGLTRFRLLAFLMAVTGAAAVYVPLTLLGGAWIGSRVAQGAATWQAAAFQFSQVMLLLTLVGAALVFLGRRSRA